MAGLGQLQLPLATSLRGQVEALLQQHRAQVDFDPQGAPVLRDQFLGLGLSPAQRVAVQAQGFELEPAPHSAASLGLDLLVLHDARARGAARAMRALRQAAPTATFTYQHLYLPAGQLAPEARAAVDASSPSAAGGRQVGLIDGGVDRRDPALAHARIQTDGCAAPSPSPHGTAVAARLVDGDDDTLYAADLWCGEAVGAAVSNLVGALAWMDRERVAVINISLVGPDDPVLARAVQTMLARGHVLVAAVGNEGPAAPPLFPAAYPGVIGVAGVDAHGRVLPESGSGAQVDFCASGVVGHGVRMLRGTSFAAPIVARKAAHAVDAPQSGAADLAMQRLIGQVRAGNRQSRNPRCGFGLLTSEN